MNSTEISLDERIRTFADSVREYLDDLPRDEVDDIMTGLIADLADQAADDDAALDLDDPVGYAEELRAAAGLPDRATAMRREPLRARVAGRLSALAGRIPQSTFGSWMLDLLLSLRPVWWMLRGFGVYAVAHALFGSSSFGGSGSILPDSLFGWLILAAVTLVSVQWGRDRWLPKNALRHMRTVVSIIALIALPFAVASVLTPRVEYAADDGYLPAGLLLDGIQVGNVFAYDENGELIDRVQLYTDKGTPLDLYGADAAMNGIEFGWKDDAPVVPFTDARNSTIWNIYPLDEGSFDPETGIVLTTDPTPAAPPFVRAPGLLSPTPEPTPGSTDTPVDDDATPAP